MKHSDYRQLPFADVQAEGKLTCVRVLWAYKDNPAAVEFNGELRKLPQTLWSVAGKAAKAVDLYGPPAVWEHCRVEAGLTAAASHQEPASAEKPKQAEALIAGALLQKLDLQALRAEVHKLLIEKLLGGSEGLLDSVARSLAAKIEEGVSHAIKLEDLVEELAAKVKEAGLMERVASQLAQSACSQEAWS